MTSPEPTPAPALAADAPPPPPPRGEVARRRRRTWLFAALAVALALVARVVVSGSGSLSEGREALAAAASEGAVHELHATVALREAVSWYLPIYAPWRGEAADLLWTLHERQLADGRLPEAVRTLSALRSGLYAARSLVHPDDALLARVDAAMAPLLARWEAEAAAAEGRPSPGTAAEREAHYAETLTWDARPSRLWGTVAVLGFFAWVLAVARATSVEGRRRWRWLGASLLAFAAFLAGVALA